MEKVGIDFVEGPDGEKQVIERLDERQKMFQDILYGSLEFAGEPTAFQKQVLQKAAERRNTAADTPVFRNEDNPRFKHLNNTGIRMFAYLDNKDIPTDPEEVSLEKEPEMM